MTGGWIAALGVAVLLLGIALPYAVRPLLRRLNAVDVPVARSSHTAPVLRGLGLGTLGAVLAGHLAALGLAAAFPAPAPAAGTGFGHGVFDVFSVTLLLLIALGAGVMGLCEDLIGLSVTVRSLLQLGLALVAGVALTVHTGQPWPLALYSVFFISSFINVANFMDGLNGISGFHGVIAGVHFALAGWLSNLSWLTAVGVVLAAAFAGFLVWNLSGRGFLGDVGSYLLGAMIAVTSFAALVAGVPVLVTIGPMIIYFADVGWTLVKRVRRGEKWSDPHKEHVYQRVQQHGYSHVAASGVTALFTLAACGVSLTSYALPPIWWLVPLAFGLALVAVYVNLPRVLPARHARVARTKHGVRE